MIKKRAIGFHAPITLPHDATAYVDAVTTYSAGQHQGSHTAVPGNDAAKLAALKAQAAQLAPAAQRIADLEAQLSAAYADYDVAAVGLWHDFSEARDFARLFAEHHDLHDLASIADTFVYHAGRAHRVQADGKTAK